MKGVTQVFQFLLFFLIGLSIFISIGVFFKFQFDIFGEDIVNANRKLLGEVFSSITVVSTTCKQCDNVSFSVKLANLSTAFVNEISLSKAGINITTSPIGKSDIFSIHNVNFSISDIGGQAFANLPIILTYSKTQNKLRVDNELQ